MELKRLLTRANALLLQGAYQGAESFIEQAMAEADKLKSELSELDTLRTRVTEMAAEVERLHSVIDEANAQEYSAIIREGGDSLWAEVSDKHNLKHGDALYARPVPAQQSAYFLTEYIAPAESVDAKNFGAIPDAQQSPAVAVPDGWKLVPKTPTTEMLMACAEAAPTLGAKTSPDCTWTQWAPNARWKAMVDAAPIAEQSPRITEHEPTELELHRGDYNACKEAGLESPGELLAAHKYLLANRITEQDARDELISDLEQLLEDSKSTFNLDAQQRTLEHIRTQLRALLNKLNGDKNGK